VTFLLGVLAASSHGQPSAAGKKLSEADIIKYLDQKIPESDLITLVKRQTVDFALTPAITAILVRKGAGDNLLTAIGSGKGTAKDLEISSPFSEQEVPHSMPVRGRSKDFTDQGKHLWLFAHREDLTDMWWPQQSSLMLKASGEWMHGVTFGSDDDIGFDFEVVAIWVDSEVDRKLQTYIKQAVRTGEYPPMPLPVGGPTETVRVRRVK